MRKRLGIACPSPDDATSFWRGMGPLQKMWKQLPNEYDFEVFGKALNWSDIGFCDAIFVQRPFKREWIELIQIAKQKDVKIWLDYDDDLLNVPISNPGYKHFGDKEMQRIMIQILSSADVITVSTQALKDLYGKHCPNKTIVIPNAYPDTLPQPKIGRSMNVLWRGSKTHDEDIYEFLPEIGRVAQAHPEFKFIFIGNPFFAVAKVMDPKQCIIIDPLRLGDYYETIQRLAPRFTMVPLSDHLFNRAKSNIAWQEGTMAGSTCLVPKWPEWEVDGPVHYDTPKQFGELLDHMLSEPDIYLGRVARSWKTLKENYSIEIMNHKRFTIMESLFWNREITVE